MAFCIYCGQVVERQWVHDEARERKVCISCAAVQYENPTLLVACLIYWRQQVLLCRRARDPARGYWFPPTGFVEAGETLEEAAARELQEEAGLSVSPSCMRLYGVASLPHMNQVYVSFRAELLAEPKMTAGEESLEVRLFSEAEIPFQQLAFNEMSNDFLPDFFRQLRDSEFRAQSVTLRRSPTATVRP